VDRLGVRAIALHLGLYERSNAAGGTAWFARKGLVDHGWTVQRTAGPVWLLKHLRTGVPTTLPAQDPTSRVFCQGWYGDTGNGRYMSETHAPFWIYGRGTLRLQFAPSRLTPRIRVDGGRSLEVQ